MSMNQAPVAAVNTELVGSASFTSFDSLGDAHPSAQQKSHLNTHIAGDERQIDVQSTDVLVQLRSNLSQLEELHARLRFVMAEVSYLLKR